MKKKLPKTIYVKWDGNPDEPYMIATEDWDTLAGLHERHIVGTYQLVEISDVVSETKIVKRKR